MASELHPSQLYGLHSLTRGLSHFTNGLSQGIPKLVEKTGEAVGDVAKKGAEEVARDAKKFVTFAKHGGEWFWDHNPGVQFTKGEIDAFKKKDWAGGLTGGAGVERAQEKFNEAVTDMYTQECKLVKSKRCEKFVHSKGFKTALTVDEDLLILGGTGGLGAGAVVGEEGAAVATEISTTELLAGEEAAAVAGETAAGTAEVAAGTAEVAGGDLVVEGAATDEVYGSAATRTSKVKTWLQKAPVKFLRFSAEGSLLGTALQLGLPYLLSSPKHRADAPLEVRQAADRFVALVVLVVAVALLLYLLAR